MSAAAQDFLEGKRAEYVSKYRSAKNTALAHFSKGRLNGSLLFLSAAASFATSYHLGFWHDDELENLIELISSSMFPQTSQAHHILKGNNEGNILYLTTTLGSMGGHSEVLRLWLKLIAREFNGKQFVISRYSISPGFRSKVGTADVVFETVGENNLRSRINALVEKIIRIRPSKIILFVDPTDVGALVAVSAVRKSLSTRIIFYDHADALFWLGKNVIDILVEFCSSRADFARERRHFSGKIAIVPFTTDIDEQEGLRGNVAARLEKRTISLSVGSMGKAYPDDFWDYFGTIKTILEEHSNHVHVFLAGGGEYAGYELSDWPESVSSRLIVKSNVWQIAEYYREADFVIETFPLVGGQARVEAMACGLPGIFILNPRFAFTLWHSGIGQIRNTYPFVAESNADVIDHARTLIKDCELRKTWGTFLRGVFEEHCSPLVVSDKLNSLVMNDESVYYDYDRREVSEVNVDDWYLFGMDLKRGERPSPFLTAISSWRKMRGVRIRALVGSLRNLELDDWGWFFRRIMDHVRRMAEGKTRRFDGVKRRR